LDWRHRVGGLDVAVDVGPEVDGGEVDDDGTGIFDEVDSAP
jgi:hypothetical protein